ncbi:translation initiation factor IF-2 isoform X2 [Syngnathoides biaculeatus]|uniref:translation initiation factor IF-2 isoform X2 n=1 Tax=Syngnathoides biaculeatus TaxID=300417 RepID=UPI002ADD79E9|nr:translation initiation factor IF-2 isoform X2 [Syngnathoides biaculeatus]
MWAPRLQHALRTVARVPAARQRHGGGEAGILLDVDGVLLRGGSVIPAARRAFRKLLDADGRFLLPVVFVTNAGSCQPQRKAQQLSALLDVRVGGACVCVCVCVDLVSSVVEKLVCLRSAGDRVSRGRISFSVLCVLFWFHWAASVTRARVSRSVRIRWFCRTALCGCCPASTTNACWCRARDPSRTSPARILENGPPCGRLRESPLTLDPAAQFGFQEGGERGAALPTAPLAGHGRPQQETRAARRATGGVDGDRSRGAVRRARALGDQPAAAAGRVADRRPPVPRLPAAGAPVAGSGLQPGPALDGPGALAAFGPRHVPAVLGVGLQEVDWRRLALRGAAGEARPAHVPLRPARAHAEQPPPPSPNHLRHRRQPNDGHLRRQPLRSLPGSAAPAGKSSGRGPARRGGAGAARRPLPIGPGVHGRLQAPVGVGPGERLPARPPGHGGGGGPGGAQLRGGRRGGGRRPGAPAPPLTRHGKPRRHKRPRAGPPVERVPCPNEGKAKKCTQSKRQACLIYCPSSSFSNWRPQLILSFHYK